MIKKVILDKADRLYHFPIDIEDYFPRTPISHRVGQNAIIDLGRFKWFSEEISEVGNRPMSVAEPGDIHALKAALADWFQSVHNIEVDPRREIYIGMGIKRILLDHCLAFVEPGDIVLVPEPGHPMYRRYIIAAGGIPVSYPLSDRSEYLPSIKRLSSNLLKTAKILILNNPHNPLGTLLDEAALTELVRVASRHNIFIVNDAAYASLAEEKYVSLLSAPRGEKVSLEIFSIPFAFGLSYFPLGFAVGSSEIIAGLETIGKTIGNYIPQWWINCARWGIEKFPSENLKKIRKSVALSRMAAAQMIEKFGWKGVGGNHAPFIWLRIPQRKQSSSFAATLLRRRQILTLPGVAFGDNGEGFLRLSLTSPAENYKAAEERLAARLMTRKIGKE
jgi:aspartate/methionine/tyrosine aminotransferase